MPVMNAKGKTKTPAARARKVATRRKNSLAKAAASGLPIATTKGCTTRGRRATNPTNGSEDVADTPDSPTTSGKYLAGQTPEGFGNLTAGARKIEDTSEASEYEDAESREPSYEPSVSGMDEIGEDSAESNALKYASVANAKEKGKKGAAKPVKKMVYKKGVRKDTKKFTTTHAMADAEEEIDPRVAAFRGKALKSGGNGRKKGRKLIRWTPQADQLLLLCLHHELTRTKYEVPYRAIAQRMFPEKYATGGAIKERFAKLRIECLNRGSWVPPVLGKAPQGTRPDVRGVVRLAPGVDKGRFILWKEDASRLIDPKDINKGYVKAQENGLQYPERIWISVEGEEEFIKRAEEHEALHLSPLAVPIPIDDDELLSDADDEEEDNEDVESEDEIAVPRTPNKRKALVVPNAPKKKARVILAASSKKSAKETKVQTNDNEVDDIMTGGKVIDTSSKKRLSGNWHKNVVNSKGVEYTDISMVAQSDNSHATILSQAVNSEDQSEDENSFIQTDNGLVMMAFDQDEEIKPLRSIVVVRGLDSNALLKYPPGIQGPGDDNYTDDEVVENFVASNAGGNAFFDPDSGVRQFDPEFQFVDGVNSVRQVQNSAHNSTFKQFGTNFPTSHTAFNNTQSNLSASFNSSHSKFKQYDNRDVLAEMKKKKHNVEPYSANLWQNHIDQRNALKRKQLLSAEFNVNCAQGLHLATPEIPHNAFSGFNSQLVDAGNPEYNTQGQYLSESKPIGNGCDQFGFENRYSSLGYMPGEEATSKTTVNSHELQMYSNMMLPLQSNQESFVKNDWLGTSQYQQPTGSDSYTNINPSPESGLTGASVESATTGVYPGTGDEFFSYDDFEGAFDGTDERDIDANATQTFFNDAYGPIMAAQGHYDYEGYPWL